MKYSIDELSKKIESGEVSVVSVVAEAVEQIKRLNGAVNAFITVLEEQAMREAEKLDDELRKGGRPRSRLHGIPIALKDMIYVKGVRCTAGSKILQNFTPNYDSTVVRKIKEAGAVVIGTNNLHEFASGVTSVNPFYGPVHNPWDLSRIAGGSSGGSAAAVSSRMVFASLGTDTSGSIRIPSSLCGVVGLKPTYGRVSKYGVIPLSWSLDHVGPIAKTVKDVAIVLEVIAGYDAADESSVVADVPDYASLLELEVKNYRVYHLRDPMATQTAGYIDAMLGKVFDALSELGIEVVEGDFKYADRVRECWAPIRLGEAAAFHDEWYRSNPQDYGDDVRRMLEKGRKFSVVDYVKAQRLRIEIKKELLSILDKYHAIITPTTLIPAPKIGEEQISIDGLQVDIYTALTSTTILFNITGVPAITLPAYLVYGKLPLGIQIAAKPFDELNLLRIAHQLEKQLKLNTVPPIDG